MYISEYRTRFKQMRRNIISHAQHVLSFDVTRKLALFVDIKQDKFKMIYGARAILISNFCIIVYTCHLNWTIDSVDYWSNGKRRKKKILSDNDYTICWYIAFHMEASD